MAVKFGRTSFPVVIFFIITTLLLSGCGGGSDQTTAGAGSTSGSTPPLPNSRALTVYRSGTGTGYVSSSNVTGIDCGGDCSETYNTSTTVTLTAVADANSTFTGWSGACSGSTCSVSMSAAHSVTAIFTSSTPPPSGSLPTGIYTDLASAPVGAFVTVYGIDSATSTWPVYSHGNGKTVVQVPSSPPPLTVDNVPIPVSVHTGRVLERTTATLTSADISEIRPGDVIYLHAGTYTGHYGSTYWNESNFVMLNAGSAAQPVAIVAYPGETVTINGSSNAHDRANFYLGNSGGGLKGSYLTIAGLNLIAQTDTISGGGNTANSSTPESGAAYVRVVGCTHTILNATDNTMTGIISIQGDGWKVLGNTLYDPVNRTIINNNHGIYVQNGADDVEIAYNALINLRMGHTIQVHQDGTPMLYTNVWIHDNLIQGTTSSDARGITVSNVDNASTVRIEGNVLRNVGQNFSGLSVYRGVVQARNNTFENILGPAMDVSGNYGGTRTVYESGNTFMNVSGGNFTAGSGASLSDFVHE